MRGAAPRSVGREKRPECVSCRPTSRSSVVPKRSRCASTSVWRSAVEVADGVLADDQLVGVGAAVLADGDGFAAPDQLGAAQAEVVPAPSGQLAGPAVERAVPAFHRQDAPAIAGAQAARLERPGERRGRRRLQRFVERQARDRGRPGGRGRPGRSSGWQCGGRPRRRIVYRICRKRYDLCPLYCPVRPWRFMSGLASPILGEHGTRVGPRPRPSQPMATMAESERRASRASMRAPALFIGFPSPLLVKDGDYAKALRRCGIQLRAPRGIVVASAHWHTVRPLRVTGSQRASTTPRLRGLSVLAQRDELSVSGGAGPGHARRGAA